MVIGLLGLRVLMYASAASIWRVANEVGDLVLTIVVKGINFKKPKSI